MRPSRPVRFVRSVHDASATASGTRAPLRLRPLTRGYPLAGRARGAHRAKETRTVIVGVPTEVKDNEYRVALTPEGARELVDHGHTGAGPGRRGRRLEHPAGAVRAGRRARSSPDADEVWAEGRHDPQGQGARRRPSTTGCARARSSSPTSTWPPIEDLTKALLEPQGDRRWRTRRCSSPTGACRCWRP